MSRLLEVLRRWWRHAAQTIASGVRRLYRAVVHAARRIRNRWSADFTFRRTISTAITALSTTAIPSPTVSAAVSAYLADRPRRLSSSFADREDYEDDDEDGYATWRPSSSRLWDRLD